MTKSLIKILLLLSLIFTLVSCGSPEKQETNSSMDFSSIPDTSDGSETSENSETSDSSEASESSETSEISDASEISETSENSENSDSSETSENSENSDSSKTSDGSVEICVHNFGEWETVVSATCETEGMQTRGCLLCGEAEEMVIEATGHKEEDISEKLPTCTETGLSLGKKCQICDKVLKEQEVVSALGHSYKKDKDVSSTCTKKGYTLYKCSCGDSYKDNYQLLAEHVYEETVIAPTCSKKGYTLHKCTSCDDSYKDNYTEQSHEYTVETISPTCESEGYDLHECKLCKDSYKTDFTEKSSHQYEKAVILPTISASGYTKYTCKICKETYTDNKTDYDSICKNGYANNETVLAMGIDVSKWNHRKDSSGNYLPLDWVAIKNAGVDFVILKAGSTKGPDPVFEMNYKGAKDAGLDVGAYYYTYAMDVEASKKDALDFISLIKGKKFEYPLYMDFEDSTQRSIPSKTKTEMIKVFATALQESGYYAGLYTGYYWMNPRFDILEADIVIDMLDIWFAHIDSADSVSVDTVYKWSADNNLGHSEFGMWQYAHKGVFDFIKNEYFDFNYAYKDYPSIIKKLGLNGYSGYVPETEYVWVKVKNLNVRSYWDTSVSSNILGIIHKGEKYEIVEKTKEYVKIIYNGNVAFISADIEHVSFTEI